MSDVDVAVATEETPVVDAPKRRGWPKGKPRKVNGVIHTAEHKNADVPPLPETTSPTDDSGIIPFEFKVLVRPDALEDKTKGGIIIPDMARDEQQRSVRKGTIVAVSPAAFSYYEWGAGAIIPKPGDRVVFARYSGSLVIGKDDVEYRLLNDKDIGAIILY